MITWWIPQPSITTLPHEVQSGVDRCRVGGFPEPIRFGTSCLGVVRNRVIWNTRTRWCLQTDSDIVPEPETMTKMLALGERQPVVFGAYEYKTDRSRLVAGSWRPGFPGWADRGLWAKREGEEVEDVDWIGSGAVLINAAWARSVYPIFESPTVKIPPGYGPDREPVSEDMGLCMKLKSLGVPIVLRRDLLFRHVERG